ncbi:TQO small subunit DoxA domain-containing protein [Sulfobacillus thermosulfidooxidans]|uniref:TQO small subunit DoxA domain-containing protein n=1 Tax=Sulfobacillus thermosulfidooxidans TaxID=28034 RepID=UPI0006B648C9|nr:TQO small subunit DoxA domain-containing protein [Sulfobacillus thermosulfidooxidans]
MQESHNVTHQEHPLPQSKVKKQSVWMLIVAIFLTLWAYQFEHHGLWGKLVNYNKTPKLVLTRTALSPQRLALTIYRPNGPDTYGSFVVQVMVKGETSATPAEVWGPKQLAHLTPSAIHNKYFFQKVSTGPWGLVVPLSAQATIQLPLDNRAQMALKGQRDAIVKVEDVSGLTWQTTVPIHP